MTALRALKNRKGTGRLTAPGPFYFFAFDI